MEATEMVPGSRVCLVQRGRSVPRTKDIHRRVGPEIPDRSLRRALEALVDDGQLVGTGETRWRKYRLKGSLGDGEDDGR